MITVLAFLHIYLTILFGFLCNLYRDILSVVGYGVPKICNTYGECVAKRTPNTEFPQNPNTKRYLIFKQQQTLIETFIENRLNIKEMLDTIPVEFHMC
jgi:hypothetical protein